MGRSCPPPLLAITKIPDVARRRAVEQWDADPDTFNTEAMPPGHDGGEIGD